MKLTISKWTVIKAALAELVKFPLPTIPSYRLGRLYLALQRELMAFEQARVEMVRKMAGSPDKDGNITVLPEKAAEFKTAIDALITEEIEIEFKPIPLSMMNDAVVRAELMAGCVDLFVE